MGDCLKALQESKGNMEDAFVILRKRGMASAAKKASRTTNEGAVSVLLGNGDGTFRARLRFDAGANPQSVVSVDLDGDGRPDLAVASANSKTVNVLLNRCQ